MARKGKTVPSAKKANRAREERRLVFQPGCIEDLEYWAENDPRTLRRIFKLMKDVGRNPFEGIGKPEPLKHLGPDIWSRRITEEHRLVYIVSDEQIDFLMARYHY